MSRNNKFFLIVGAVTILWVLAACGAPQSGTDTVVPASAPAKEVVKEIQAIAPAKEDLAAEPADSPYDGASPTLPSSEVEAEPPGTDRIVADPSGERNNTAQETANSLALTLPGSEVADEAIEIVREDQPSIEIEAENGPNWSPTPLVPHLRTGGQVGNLAPEFRGIFNWINSEPLTMEELRGKVVLVDFWTFGCINCINTMPYLKEWHSKYAEDGLVIVGVHTPEASFEKPTDNVVEAMAKFGLEYPVAQDNDFRTWNAYYNRYWPSEYLVDKDGVIRYRHFGEGVYKETENQIRNLLEEIGADLS